MELRAFIVRLLSIFLIAGLVAAPLMTPAAAKHSAATSMSAMSGDMPCCPDEPATGGCNDCPLIAMCSFSVAQAEAPVVGDIQVFFNARRLQLAPDDMMVDGLIAAPPDQPPRLSI